MFGIFKVLLLIGLCWGVSVSAMAQEPVSQKSLRYAQPTLQNISKLYWAIGRMSLEKNADIDNFLMINECALYTDFHLNELEWVGVRQSTQDYLKKSLKVFPTRFEVFQPLMFGKYDTESSAFDIQASYRFDGVKFFEVAALGGTETPCSSTVQDIEGYSRSFALEFSKPFSLYRIPVRKDLAETYLKDKTELDTSDPDKVQQSNYEDRNGYIVLKFSVLGNSGDYTTEDHKQMPKVFAVLEDVEVYADKDRKILLYSERYASASDQAPAGRDGDLKKRYQERLKEKLAEKNGAKPAVPAPVPTGSAPASAPASGQ